ncbi:MAG TPA: heterodisulfide reductase-related iron-sulfur binding cluster, partial [Dehalococcoidales bacterium]|nr:heterodisulfide reductase-related iron-sulfur binding cluster [Dehalococcoidales bacterium]
ISEVAHDAIKEEKLKPKHRVNLKVTYHDPCFLGRLSEKYIPWNGKIEAYGVHVPPKPWRRGTYGVYEAPREVFKAMPGINLAEMPRNAENAFCCGAGGGVPAVAPDFTRWTASERLDEAQSTGAEALVSACPFCQDAFSEPKKKMKYLDFTELVVRSL